MSKSKVIFSHCWVAAAWHTEQIHVRLPLVTFAPHQPTLHHRTAIEQLWSLISSCFTLLDSQLYQTASKDILTADPGTAILLALSCGQFNARLHPTSVIPQGLAWHFCLILDFNRNGVSQPACQFVFRLRIKLICTVGKWVWHAWHFLPCWCCLHQYIAIKGFYYGRKKLPLQVS